MGGLRVLSVGFEPRVAKYLAGHGHTLTAAGADAQLDLDSVERVGARSDRLSDGTFIHGFADTDDHRERRPDGDGM